MPYGTIKVDNITFTNAGSDQTITVSGLFSSTSGNLTVTGTVSGNTIQGQTISGVTVTGTTANFTSGNFTNISGGTHTITSGVFAAGSAAAPSISFVSDPNTGIYSPGADQVAISTNGAGRLYVDASGNIEVRSGNLTLGPSGGEGGQLNISNTTNTGAVYVLDASTDTNARLFTTNNNVSLQVGQLVGTGGNVQFFTEGFERIRLDASGRLGIGTSSPGSKLEIAGTSGSAALGLVETGVRSWAIRAGGATTNKLDIADLSAGQTRLTIDSSGNVGIGTASPGSILEVSQNQATYSYFDFYNITAGGGIVWRQIVRNIANSGTTSIDFVKYLAGGFGIVNNDTNAANFTAFNVGASERMRLDSSGNVGIGTTSPGVPLTIQADSNAFGTDLIGRAADNTSVIRFKTSDNITALGSIGQYGTTMNINSIGAGPIAFYTNNTEHARIDSSGRLLVGTSTAYGTALTQIQGSSSNATDPGSVFLRRGYTSTEIANYLGTELGLIDFGSKDGGVGARIFSASDGTWSSTSDCPSRLVFSTTADGASSPTERMRISNLGFVPFYSQDSNVLYPCSSKAAGTSDNIIVGTYGATAVNTGTASFVVRTNGDVQNTNNSYGALSDLKLKENIVDANSQWDDLKALQVRNYNFKEGQTHTQIGLVAQEVELVSPGLVTESPDRDEEGNDLGTVTKSVNYSVLYMKAIKALQEAMERIETLEAKVAALEAQ